MNNLTAALTPRHPADVTELRTKIHHPLFQKLSDIEIETVWDSFSDNYCASWLNLSDGLLKDFEVWLDS